VPAPRVPQDNVIETGNGKAGLRALTGPRNQPCGLPVYVGRITPECRRMSAAAKSRMRALLTGVSLGLALATWGILAAWLYVLG